MRAVTGTPYTSLADRGALSWMLNTALRMDTSSSRQMSMNRDA